MPRDPLHDAVYLGIEQAIEENYRGVDGSYPVSPTAVATLASVAALAAIEEHGYAIVSVAPAQPSGTLQDAQTSGNGMMGPLAHADGSTGLSDVHMEIADRHGTRRITFPDATPGERAALMHAVELDDLRTELEIARIGQRRAEKAEEALDAAQQTIARVLQHALRLGDDDLAAALLNLNPDDCSPEVALRALETQGESLTEENHRDA